MSDRVYASAFYIALIIGSSWIAVSLGETLARNALTKLALLPSHETRPSRVETYLAAQEHATKPSPTKDPLIPSASAMPLGALAKAMDEAEQSHGTTPTSAETPDAGSDAMAETPPADKPKVAGWVKRIPKRAISVSAPDETASHIIMRSLRAEM